MVGRIRFIYLLFIILISFGTIGGCGDPCACEGIRIFGDCCPPPPPCNAGEIRCGGECVPGVECCDNVYISGDIPIACPQSKPFCCPDGDCASDFVSCPDITECPEHFPQFCGPFCIAEDDACCNEGRTDIEPIFCGGFVQICCPDGTCRATIECCGQSSDCGFLPDFGPPPF